MGGPDTTNDHPRLVASYPARRTDHEGTRFPGATAACSIAHVHERPPPLPPLLVRLELGLAAFAPAIALLAIQSSSVFWFAVLLGVIAVLSFLLLAMIILIVSKRNPETFEFTKIEDLGREVMGHVSAYLVPLLVGSTGSVGEIAIGALTLSIIVHLHIVTGRVLVNPLLYLLGYRLYRAWSGGQVYYLIARSDVSRWDTSKSCIQVTDGIAIESKQ